MKKRNYKLFEKIFLTSIQLSMKELVYDYLAYYPELALSTDEGFHQFSALHIAVGIQDKEITNALLSNGANVNALDEYHHTPLAMAVQLKNHAIVKLLVEAGADLNIKTTVNHPFIGGQTPLYWASMWGYEAMVVQLLQAGAQVNLKDIEDKTPLYYAVRWRNEKVVKRLLEAGARLDLKNNKGRTVLHTIANSIFPSAAIIKLLIQWGGSWTEPDNDGITPQACVLRRQRTSTSSFWKKKDIFQEANLFRNKIFTEIKMTYQLNQSFSDSIIEYFLRTHTLWYGWEIQAKEALNELIVSKQTMNNRLPPEIEDLIITHHLIIQMKKYYEIAPADGIILIDQFFWKLKYKQFSIQEREIEKNNNLSFRMTPK